MFYDKNISNFIETQELIIKTAINNLQNEGKIIPNEYLISINYNKFSNAFYVFFIVDNKISLFTKIFLNKKGE